MCAFYSFRKVKGEVVPVLNQALCQEGVWESGCIDPRFLYLGTSWRRVVSFTPLPRNPPGEGASVTHCIEGWVGP
jgi:hypothetical protein